MLSIILFFPLYSRYIHQESDKELASCGHHKYIVYTIFFILLVLYRSYYWIVNVGNCLKLYPVEPVVELEDHDDLPALQSLKPNSSRLNPHMADYTLPPISRYDYRVKMGIIHYMHTVESGSKSPLLI